MKQIRKRETEMKTEKETERELAEKSHDLSPASWRHREDSSIV